MLKTLLGIMAVSALFAAIALPSQIHKQPNTQHNPASHRYRLASFVETPNDRYEGDADDSVSSDRASHWYTPLEDSTRLLVIVGYITCGVLIWQTIQASAMTA